MIEPWKLQSHTHDSFLLSFQEVIWWEPDLSWKRFEDRRVKAVFRHGPHSKCVDLACDTESSLAATGRNGLLMTSYRTQRMLPSPLMYPIQCTARLRINKFTALSQCLVKATLVCLLCFWFALHESASNWGFYNADVIDLVDAYDVSITLGNDQLLKQHEVRIADD